MNNNTIMPQQNHIEEPMIDIKAIIFRLWEKKKFIVKVIFACAFIGLIIAVFSPKVYVSSCTFVPQTAKKTNSSISSLAALAGINLGSMASGETLSPLIYPQILENIEFKKELMYSKIKFAEYDEPITIIDYYTNPEYARFNLFGTIKKYTIGLPGLIIGAIKGTLNDQNDSLLTATDGNYLNFFSKDEYACVKILRDKVSMMLEEKKGYITIIANMGDPVAAAQLCQTTFDLLEKYITAFKISKAEQQQAFIKDRYEETKANYEEKQKALAQFMDANKVLSTAQARTEQDRLVAEYNMANTIYTEMAKQLLQADVQVKEDTPILTPINPVVVPYKKSKPQTMMILFVWCFMGGFLGCGLVLGGDWLKNQGFEHKWLDKIVRP